MGDIDIMETVEKNFNKIKIKDFGPIKEADIDIAPLTIFIGPNSSGKSFTALVTYSIFTLFGKEDNIKKADIGLKSINFLLEEDRGLFVEFTKEFGDFIKTKPKIDDTFQISSIKFNKLLSNGVGKYYNHLIEKRLKKIFKVEDLNKLISLNKQSFFLSFNNINFEKNISDFIMEGFSYNFYPSEEYEEDGILLKIFKEDDNVIIKLDYNLWIRVWDKNEEYAALIIYDLLSRSIINSLIQNSHYIPAARDEISKNFLQYLSNNINRDVFDLSEIHKEVSTDILNIMQQSKEKDFYDLACDLEKELFGGEIHFIENDVNKGLIFTNYENDFNLPFNLLSSSITETTPLILYLKYILEEGDTLIIEEPEAHLHPKNQIILVKYLVRAINQGLNIILTTHSDYVIEQFNNFIRLGNADKKIFKELNFTEQDILNFEDINIYHFKNDGDYNFIANPLEINSTGFNEENFIEVIKDLTEESDIIIDNKMG